MSTEPKQLVLTPEIYLAATASVGGLPAQLFNSLINKRDAFPVAKTIYSDTVYTVGEMTGQTIDDVSFKAVSELIEELG